MIEPKYGQIDPSTPEGRKAVGEGNRASWNVATKAHNSHKKDQAKFFRDGGSKLYPEEIGLLGDVKGKKVLHLQCNAGQDTLSIANLGGVVTGVDISDEAIDFARKLSADSGVPGTFHRADVYDWLEEAANGDERWDIVFCSYGAIIWLADLGSWAKGFAKLLKPGGRFVTVEFHPVEMMFETDYSHRYPYSTRGKPITWDDGILDYVAEFGPDDMPYEYVEGETEFSKPASVPRVCLEPRRDRHRPPRRRPHPRIADRVRLLQLPHLQRDETARQRPLDRQGRRPGLPHDVLDLSRNARLTLTVAPRARRRRSVPCPRQF